MLTRRNCITDPRFIVASGWTGVSAGGNVTAATSYSPAVWSYPGETWCLSFDITAPAGTSISGTICPRPCLGTAFGAVAFNPKTYNVPAGTTQRIYQTQTIGTDANSLRAYWTCSLTDGTVKVDRILLEKCSVQNPYFDGASVATPPDRYSWQGSANTSFSEYYSLNKGARRNLALCPNNEISSSYWVSNNVSNWVMSDDATLFWQGTKSRKSTPQAPVIGTLTSIMSMFDVGGPPINVTQGKNYIASAYVQHNSAQAGTYARIGYLFRDSGGAAIGAITSVSTIIPPNVWNRISVTTPTPPSNAVTCRFFIFLDVAAGKTVAAGEFAWADGALIEEGTVLGAYFDGASVSTSDMKYSWEGTANSSVSDAEPTMIYRHNLCTDPGLESAVGGWGPWYGTGGAGTNAKFADGTAFNGNCYRVTFTTAPSSGGGGHIFVGQDGGPNLGGKRLTGSAWLRCSAAVNVYVEVAEFSGGTYMGKTAGTFVGTVALAPNTWTRVYYTTPPLDNGCDKTDWRWYISGAGLATNSTFDIDSCLIEYGSNLGIYFDGQTPPGDQHTYQWAGTQYLSDSYALYRNDAAASSPPKTDGIYNSLVGNGYGPGSMADMEYNRLLAKNSLTAPQKLSLMDLYALAGERPRIGAFRK